jgi:hypothetical protein
MMRLILAMEIGGGFLVFMGVQEMRLRSVADDAPQSITCAELEANGPGDNAHIALQEFELCDLAYVYEGQENGGSWSKVWVPAVPVGGEYYIKLLSTLDAEGNAQGEVRLPTNIKLIVKSNDVENESQLGQLAALDSIEGMIVNEISSLGSEEKKLLKESYPGADFDTCYIMEVGRKPATAGKMFGLGGGGLALMLVGGGLFMKFKGA